MSHKLFATFFITFFLLGATNISTPSISAAPELAYVVNSSADTNDGACDMTDCTLREAINAANAHLGLDTIAFGFDSCPCIIYPATQLPDITDPVIINGYSQDGSAPAEEDTPAVIVVTLRGFNTPGTPNGLVVSGGNSIIKGLAINAFKGAGIWLKDKGGNTIEGNILGLFASRGNISPNNDGVLISNGSSQNVIGGSTHPAINVISGNTVAGIEISADGGQANRNIIVGNYIGTTPKFNPFGNGTGIIIHTKKNEVGAQDGPYGNLIAANVDAGIEISGSGARANLVGGNVIGAFGSQYPSNGTYGILIKDGASRNEIGMPGQSNTIAFNGADGVVVMGDDSRRNSVRGNYIAFNGGLGLDLGDNGVTLNDAGDSDAGPNKLQNYPVLKSFNQGTGLLKGKMTGAPNTEYGLDVYIESTCDASGYGEGAYQTTFQVTTKANGVIKFKFILETDFPVDYVTMTASDPKGNTSEFSNCKSG